MGQTMDEEGQTIAIKDFEKMFRRQIALWPSEIDVSEKTLFSSGGARIPNLNKIHDEIEEKLDVPRDDSDQMMAIDWAIYTVLHGTARASDVRSIKVSDCATLEMVLRVFEGNDYWTVIYK